MRLACRPERPAGRPAPGGPAPPWRPAARLSPPAAPRATGPGRSRPPAGTRAPRSRSPSGTYPAPTYRSDKRLAFPVRARKRGRLRLRMDAIASRLDDLDRQALKLGPHRGGVGVGQAD